MLILGEKWDLRECVAEIVLQIPCCGIQLALHYSKFDVRHARRMAGASTLRIERLAVPPAPRCATVYLLR